MDRNQQLQMMIRRIALLSKRFVPTHDALNVLHGIISNFDSAVFQSFIPGQFNLMLNAVLVPQPQMAGTGLLYADIYQDRYCHINTFGFQRAGLRLPLHDHPDQCAVMKVYQGSVRVRSFSIIERDENGRELDLSLDHEFGTVLPPNDSVYVRYEGDLVISSTQGHHSVALGLRKGNIHEVESLEDDTHFADFFFPFARTCSYYELDAPHVGQQLVPNQALRLNRIPQPPDFRCDVIPYPSFPPFFDGEINGHY